MNKGLIFNIVLLCSIALPMAVAGQANDYKVRKCFGYQRDSCTTSTNIYYRVHEESRSALFVKGQTSQTNFTIYNGRDYRISLCVDPILGGQIGLRLLDSESGNPLYDNKEDGFATEFEFTATQSRDIVIEISVPGQSGFTDAENNEELFFFRKDSDMGCIGVLIEHMITPSKGF